MYKLRITTTVEQLNHDERVLFSLTDTVDVSTINEELNTVDVPEAFRKGNVILGKRIKGTITERYGKSRG